MNEKNFPSSQPGDSIGVFDSGLGGLSIVKEIQRQMPGESVFYFADTLHMPYGPRPLDEVRRFSLSIAEQLLRLPVKAVVVACNTASAAALKPLRRAYPDRIFVGMEPAVKPAAAESKTGVVGVLATQATFQGELFESVVHRFAGDIEVVRQPCPGLAEFIEEHEPGHPALRALLEKYITPLLRRNVDSIVLGCTHYPLVKDAIAEIAGPQVAIVDPSPAVARRCHAVLHEAGLTSRKEAGDVLFTVSGDMEKFSRAAALHLGREVKAERTPFFWVPARPEDFADIWC